MAEPMRLLIPETEHDGLRDYVRRELGVEAAISDAQRSGAETIVVAVLALTLHPFLSGLMQRYGEAAAPRLARLFRRLHRGVPTVQAVDDDTGVTLVIVRDADLDRASAAMLELSLDRYEPGTTLRWHEGSDDEPGEWR